RIPWAEPLLRTFREDVLLCPSGGRRVVLAFITEKKVVRRSWSTSVCPPPAHPSRPRGLPPPAKTRPRKPTSASASKRCGAGRGLVCAYALISSCAAGWHTADVLC